MAGLRLRVGAKPVSSWSRTGPTGRLIVGAIIISLFGLSGLSPITVLGVTVPWPHAALWGAAGWGAAGLSFRPMLVLVVLGLAQDISYNAPLGSFILVNLAAYGLSASAQSAFDTERDPILGMLIPVTAIIAGFAVLWMLASTEAAHVVRVIPLFVQMLMTLALYFPLSRIFRLGGRPGERKGSMSG